MSLYLCACSAGSEGIIASHCSGLDHDTSVYNQLHREAASGGRDEGAMTEYEYRSGKKNYLGLTDILVHTMFK